MTLFIHDLDGSVREELEEKEFLTDATVVHTTDGTDIYMMFVYHITSMVAIPGVYDIALMDDAGHFIKLPNDAYHTIEVK